MNQMIFSEMEYSERKRVTQKVKFLHEMSEIIPCADWDTKALEIVQVDSSVWKRLSKEDLEEIRAVCAEKLEHYFSKLK